MLKKRYVFLQVVAMLAVYGFLDECASGIGYGRFVMLFDSWTLCTCVYACLKAAGAVAAVWMFTHFLTKENLADYALGRPYLTVRWLTAGIAVPVLLCLFYLCFVSGSLTRNERETDWMLYSIFRTVLTGGIAQATAAVTLTIAMPFGLLQKVFCKKTAAVLTALLFMASHLENFVYIPSWQNLTMTCLMEVLLAVMVIAVTLESGSAWSAVAVYALYNMIFANTTIFRICPQPSNSAIWNYAIGTENGLLTGFSVLNEIKEGLPAIVGLLCLIALAAYWLRRPKTEGRG